MDEVDDVELLVERVAALDLGKAVLEACVRVPHPQRPGRRMQELRGYGTTTAQLLAMVAWLRHWQVQRVVMESTSTYWKGVYYLLEAEGFDCWLVNAREVKNVPGRAKTDRADAVWLAKVAERGMCRPSLVQPPEIRRLRDLTRYRRALVQDRTREQQRVEKLLEDAPLTELRRVFSVFGGLIPGCVVTVRPRDWRNGYAAGSGVVDCAAAGVGRGHWRGVRAVSAP